MIAAAFRLVDRGVCEDYCDHTCQSLAAFADLLLGRAGEHSRHQRPLCEQEDDQYRRDRDQRRHREVRPKQLD
jgi:hypothetical protein